jgi:hypothetical protein
MTPYAFILSDPRAKAMDRPALQLLARELQLKLFGMDGGGEVVLLLFEGPEMEVHRFAAMDAKLLDRVVQGEAISPPLRGQLNRLTATGVEACELDWVAPPGADARGQMGFNYTFEPVFAGLYFAPRQSIIGAVASCRPSGVVLPSASLHGPFPIDGLPTESFDEACVDSALHALDKGPSDGLLFVPLSFSSLVRPAGRAAYAQFLAKLPSAQRPRMGAAIYDAPRDPSFFALAAIQRFLEPYFGQLNLQVSDPAFEIEKISLGVVSSVTLVLPDGKPQVRAAAIRRFMHQREIYKKRRVWPSVGRVDSRAELDICLAMGVPVISGPAVSDITPLPPRYEACPVEHLPVGGLA